MIALSLLAILCLVVFRGHTESLIPLYAVGVFIPFSLALFGLVRKHIRTIKLLVPLLAMVLTITVVLTLIVSKWQLIWPIVIFVPLMIFGCLRVHHHYEHVQKMLFEKQQGKSYNGQMIVLPISGIHQLSQKALEVIALQHCSDVYAVYIGQTNDEVKAMEAAWRQFAPNIRLIAFISNRQQLVQPLIRTIVKINAVAKKHNKHLVITIPQLAMKKRWHNTLHNHHAFALKQALLKYPDISVLNVSFMIE